MLFPLCGASEDRDRRLWVALGLTDKEPAEMHVDYRARSVSAQESVPACREPMQEIAQAMEQAVDERAARLASVGGCGCLPHGG